MHPTPHEDAATFRTDDRVRYLLALQEWGFSSEQAHLLWQYQQARRRVAWIVRGAALAAIGVLLLRQMGIF